MDWKQEAFKRLDAIAQNLGTTAEYLWSLLIKQAYLDGYEMLLFGLLLLVGAVIMHRMARWAHRTSVDVPDHMAGAVMGWIVSAALAVGVCDLVAEGIFHIVNPGYYALQDIIQQLR